MYTEAEIVNNLKIEIFGIRELEKRGKLTKSEADELICDKMNITEIEDMLDTEEKKIIAEKIVQALKAISGIIP
jgi:argonaute-like protein implicated in RNA metabolism and viral defense